MKPAQCASGPEPDAGRGTLLAGRYRLVERLGEQDGSAEWRATDEDFQLRAGGEPVVADLQPVASATDAGSVVTLRPARPAKARYLLLWFTQLPPDSSGTFEAIIYDVRLHGTP